MSPSVSTRTIFAISIASGIGLVLCWLYKWYTATPVYYTNTTLVGTPYRLVDFPEIKQQQTGNLRMKPKSHSILWYMPPYGVSSDDDNRALSKCAYNNCVTTVDKGDLTSHSALVFTLTGGVLGKYPPLLPPQRPQHQVWVFYYQESPYSSWRHRPVVNVPEYWTSTMNWSMTYRTDADIVSPYGVLESRNSPDYRDYGTIFDRKSKLAAWAVSHCGAHSGRDDYVRELRNLGLPIDVYGDCGYMGKPNSTAIEKMLNMEYKFYLAFENSLCPDYITEKFFQHFNLDIVIVVRGGARYKEMLPADTFIDASDFSSPNALTRYLKAVGSNKSLYTSYLQRKNKYEAVGPRSILGYCLCRMCEKLNNIEENMNVYKDVNSYIYNKLFSCTDPNDIPYSCIDRFTQTCVFRIGLFALVVVCCFRIQYVIAKIVKLLYLFTVSNVANIHKRCTPSHFHH